METRQVKDMRMGDHLCLAYAHEDEQRAVATAFVSDGLRRGERVLYFGDRPADDPTLRNWLEDSGVAVEAAVAEGRLELLPAGQAYLAGEVFDSDIMIASLRAEVDAALAVGFTGLRVSGEMGWALAAGVDASLADYERRVGDLFDEGLSAAICQYDVRGFSPGRLAGFAGCHRHYARCDDLFTGPDLRLVPEFRASGEREIHVLGAVDRGTCAPWTDALRWGAQGDGLTVDLAGLEFIDVGGMRCLVEAGLGLPAGRPLKIRNMSPYWARVLRMAGWADTPGIELETGAESA